MWHRVNLTLLCSWLAWSHIPKWLRFSNATCKGDNKTCAACQKNDSGDIWWPFLTWPDLTLTLTSTYGTYAYRESSLAPYVQSVVQLIKKKTKGSQRNSTHLAKCVLFLEIIFLHMWRNTYRQRHFPHLGRHIIRPLPVQKRQSVTAFHMRFPSWSRTCSLRDWRGSVRLDGFCRRGWRGRAPAPVTFQS